MCMDIVMVLTKVFRHSHRKHTTNLKQDIQHPDTTEHTRSKHRNRAPLFKVYLLLLYCVCFLCIWLCLFLCGCVICFVCLFVVMFCCWCFCVSILFLAIVRGFKGIVIYVNGHSDGANQGISG